MRTRRIGLVAPLLLTGVLSLAACGSDDEKTDTGASQPSAAADLIVTGVDGIKWDQESYTTTAGEVSVLLRNESQLPHTLQILAEDGTAIGAVLESTSNGDEATGTYTLAAGTYTILCTVPGHGAMKADLSVS
jgi:plastocyanin